MKLHTKSNATLHEGYYTDDYEKATQAIQREQKLEGGQKIKQQTQSSLNRVAR